MGRGRQKAKATRQAREMKYFSPETDYSALERELNAKNTKSSESSSRRYDDEMITRHTRRNMPHMMMRCSGRA